MIKLFARFFRGVHKAIGVTPIPENAPLPLQKKFVFIWFGVIAFFIGWCAIIAYWFSS